MEDRTKGILTVLSGFLIHLSIGCLYIWGNIAVYVTSWFRHYDSSVSLEETFIVLPISVITGNIFLLVGTQISLRCSERLSVILGGLILCGGVLGSSFVPNFPVFCVLYASFFGIGLGLAYMPPVLSAWSYFPEHKGRISGIIIGGFGLGAAIFNEIATVLVNPDDKEPEIEVKKGDVTDHYYDWSVSQRVPLMLQCLSAFWFVLMSAGAVLIFPIKAPEEAQQKSLLDDDVQRRTTVVRSMASKPFVLLALMCFLSVALGIYMAGAYKIYGEEHIHNDQALTVLGSVGSICNGTFRLIFGQTCDIIGFKYTYMIVLGLQIVLSATIYYVASTYWAYFLYVCIILACEGAHFTLFPTICGNIWGKSLGGKLFSILSYTVGSASIGTGLIQRFAIDSIGYQVMFLILCSCSCLSLAICVAIFREKAFIESTRKTSFENETSINA